MSDGEVEIGMSLLQDLAGGEGGFGGGEFGPDDEDNIGEWRLNQTEAGGEGVQRSASILSRSTGLGYADEGVGGRMADGRESERESCVSDRSRYSVNTMGGGLDNLGSTMVGLQPDSSVGNDFVMRTPTAGSIPIPPRVSSLSSFSPSSPPPTSPHPPTALPLNYTGSNFIGGVTAFACNYLAKASLVSTISSYQNDPTPSYQPTTPADHHGWLSTPPHLLRPPPDYYVWETVILLRRQVTLLEETVSLMRRELSELRRQSCSDFRVHHDQEDPFVRLSHLPESVLRDFKAAHSPYLEDTSSVSHRSLLENTAHNSTDVSLDSESSIGDGRSE
ncbi:hypothetical protein EYR38_002017 [Pleurotus pulmonarius]|nr:hypothetical protein EYR38_002017 [Pleurotus pulmonarius]